jgi:hypothetical protein
MKLLLLITFVLAACETKTEFASLPDDPLSKYAFETHTINSEPAKVDILFVVDNSPSMADEQKKIAQRIGSFLNYLDNVDWQIGITTTDVSNGSHGLQGELLELKPTKAKILKKHVPNYKSLFAKNIVREESSDCLFSCPSSNEQPLRAVLESISKRDQENLGFFRKDAQFISVIISDEDEKSDGPSSALKPYQLLDYIQTTFGSLKAATFYGIIIQPGDNQCMNEQQSASEAHYGYFVETLVELTGGITVDLCANDYASNLAAIGSDTNEKLNHIKLKYKPLMDTVKVTFEPEFKTKWKIENRVLKFSKNPPKGTKVYIEYEKDFN